jgi:hypothetical protein
VRSAACSGHLAYLEFIVLPLLISLLCGAFPSGTNPMCFPQHFAQRGDSVGVITGWPASQGLISCSGKRFFDMDMFYTRVLHIKVAYLTNDVTPFTSHGRCYARA